ncbi:MAG: DAK2 domain-containing protein [bacterium]|nr:DAK2 domain-containing protein [bacterium]
MAPLDSLTADHVDLLMRRYSEALAAHRSVIDALNVYPVPDGDTGTNMSLTLRAVVDALPPDCDLRSVCQAIYDSALAAGRGNSGIIVSQFLRAMAGAWREAVTIDAAGLAGSLEAASVAAYGAVARPVEGTILTVGKDVAAAAAAAARRDAPLAEVIEAAIEAGRESLERTPELLEVLRTAGVVDAGGKGLLLLLDALAHVVDGRPLPEPPEVSAPLLGDDPHHIEGAGDVADLRYEVMFLLDAGDDRIAAFRDRWEQLGDSIVVVGGDGLWNCHIHTDDIGGSIEAGIEAGRPHRIQVTDLHEQVSHVDHVAAPVRTTTGVVAVATGDGVGRIFKGLGAAELVTGGQTMNPSVATLLEAVERTPSHGVVVLPNNKNIVLAAQQLQELTDKVVVVVPTVSIPAGLSAMVEFDPESEAARNGEVMAALAEEVTAGEVTRAVRDAATPAGPVAEGDFMGLSAGDVQCVAQDLVTVTCGLLDRIVGDEHEIVTLICGAEATEADTEAVASWLADARPHVELEVHAGGQPLYHYYVGVE